MKKTFQIRHENYDLEDPQSSRNCDREETAAPSHGTIDSLEAGDGEEKLKSSQRETAFYVQRTKPRWEQISPQKQSEQEDGGATHLNYTHTKTANLKFYTQLQYLLNIKAKRSHCFPQKNKS